MLSFDAFSENLACVRAHIAEACRKAGRRAGDVRLMPVTKNHPADAPRFVARAGLPCVGENRVREAAQKRAETPECPLRWELIGHLQSNKAAAALATFERIQSVDSAALAQRLNRLCGDAAPYPILLEVNTGEDPNKFGFKADETPVALDVIRETCPHLLVEGLMTVAPLDGDADSARRAFARLRELAETLRARSGLPLRELSMGMSGDLEAAVAEGSTLVRVGTALFGARDYGAPTA